jgi:hypothetical protein
MSQYIGKNEYDFEALDSLPPAYVEYIEKLLKESTLTLTSKPDYYDSYLHAQVKTKDGELLYGLQGGPYDSTQHLFYNKKLFMFHMIPLSRDQQVVLTKRLFLQYFADEIDKYLRGPYKMNLINRHIEVRPIFFN